MSWQYAEEVTSFPADDGTCIKLQGLEIAVFNSEKFTRWYAVQNICPHTQAAVLSRGIIGSQGATTKVTCPLHKNSFDLKSGHCLSSNKKWQLKTFPVKVDQGKVYLFLSEEKVLTKTTAANDLV